MSDVESVKPTCPYCGKRAVLTNSAEVYAGSNFGNIWKCPGDCDAYVGVHGGRRGDSPKGTLANKSLRKLRIECHRMFDRIWKNGGMARREAYNFLAEIMDVPVEEAHIGMFNDGQCVKLIVNLTKITNSKGELTAPPVLANEKTN